MRITLGLVLFGAATVAHAGPDVSPVDSGAAIVRSGVESYALSSAAVSSIESELAFLVADSSAAGAQALLAETAHACSLVRDLEASQAKLAKRLERLRAKAKRVRRSKRRIAVSELEPKQRQLELVLMKFTIQGEHRRRLLVLRDATVKALRARHDPSAVTVYAKALEGERDAFMGKVLAETLGAAGSKAALPALIKALKRRALRSAAHAALIRITGRDLGDDPKAWVKAKDPQ